MVRRDGLILLIVLVTLVAARPVWAARQVEVEVILLVDTSDSMDDELRVLCGGLEKVVDDLARRGISVDTLVLGVAETGGCAEDRVRDVVPAGQTSDEEDWGLAVVDIARHYEWATEDVQMIIPLSDEGPLGGDPVNDEDERAIQAAIRAAQANEVVVSPVLGTDFNSEIEPLAQELARQTSGKVFVNTDSAEGLVDGLRDLIRAAAEQARETGSLLEAIPTPGDILLDERVISTNLVLAVLLTAVVGVAAAVLDDTLDANRDVFGASGLGRLVTAGVNLAQVVERLLAPGEWSRVPARPRRLLAALQLGLMVALVAFLGVFLQPGLNPLSWQGLSLWLGMLLVLTLMSLIYDGVQYGLARRAGAMPSLRLRPGAPLVTVSSVALSRFVGFLPGLFFGRVTVCGFRSEGEGAGRSLGRQVQTVLVGLLAVGAVGLSLWILTVPSSLLLDWLGGLELSSTVDSILTGAVGAVKGFCLLGFFLAFQMLLFELSPHPATGGGLIYRRNWILWAVITFVVVSFVLQTLLNPFGAVDEVLKSEGLVLLLLLSLLYSALAVAVWLFFALRTSDEVAVDRGQSQLTTVMAVSLVVIWMLAGCAGLAMVLTGLLS